MLSALFFVQLAVILLCGSRWFYWKQLAKLRFEHAESAWATFARTSDVTKQVVETLQERRDQLSEVLQRVHSGDHMEITRHVVEEVTEQMLTALAHFEPHPEDETTFQNVMNRVLDARFSSFKKITGREFELSSLRRASNPPSSQEKINAQSSMPEQEPQPHKEGTPGPAPESPCSRQPGA